jgi:hypothetical protein
VTKNIATFIGAKTKQVTITIKIHDRVVQRFESSIVCAMKVGEEFGVTSPGIGVALKPKFGTQVQRVGLVTFSYQSYPVLITPRIAILTSDLEGYFSC